MFSFFKKKNKNKKINYKKINYKLNFKPVKVTFTPYGQDFPDTNFKPKYSYTYKGVPGGFYV
jgi:hypothetical protein